MPLAPSRPSLSGRGGALLISTRDKPSRSVENEEMLEALKRALAELADEYGLELAVLFGSRAEGLAGPASDVDVAVLLRGPEASRCARLLGLKEALASRLRVEVDLVVLDNGHVSPAFRHVVLSKGLVLFARDKTALELLRAEAERDYLRCRREVLARLKRLLSLLGLPGDPEAWEMPEFDELVRACEGALRHLDRLSRMDYEEFAAREENFALACHFLRIALECLFDLGRRVLRLMGSPARSYGEVATALCDVGLAAPEMRPFLAELVEWRHHLTHVYFRIEPEEVYRFIREHLPEIMDLIREVMLKLRELSGRGRKAD